MHTHTHTQAAGKRVRVGGRMHDVTVVVAVATCRERREHALGKTGPARVNGS